jgi:isopenicillin N synthase-like dioxygenase
MIPVIDLAGYLAGAPGAMQRAAREIHDAFSRIGFCIMTGHDVPRRLIEQTFAEAKRLHALPMPDKLAMRLNDHNNGYMAMGRYAVWTSDVNKKRQAGPERGVLHPPRARA